MRITKWSELGVLLLSVLAEKYTPEGQQGTLETLNAQSLSIKFGIDIDYTRQVLQRLKNHELIKTVRGPTGGYYLSRPAKEISLLDIFQATEGASLEIFCDHKPLNDKCRHETNQCNLRVVWQELADHIDTFLKHKSLQDVIDIDAEWSPGVEALVSLGTEKKG